MGLTYIKIVQPILTIDKEEAEVASTGTLEEDSLANHQDEDLMVKAPKVGVFNPGTSKEGASKEEDLSLIHISEPTRPY